MSKISYMLKWVLTGFTHTGSSPRPTINLFLQIKDVNQSNNVHLAGRQKHGIWGRSEARASRNWHKVKLTTLSLFQLLCQKSFYISELTRAHIFPGIIGSLYSALGRKCLNFGSFLYCLLVFWQPAHKQQFTHLPCWIHILNFMTSSTS